MLEIMELLCASKNGKKVYYDPIASHAATHLQDTPELKNLVIEAIGTMNLRGEPVAKQIDMGRVERPMWSRWMIRTRLCMV